MFQQKDHIWGNARLIEEEKEQEWRKFLPRIEGHLTTQQFNSDVKGHFVKERPKKEEQKDDMFQKYQSIIQNDVWI